MGYITAIIILYILTILQTSFFVHFFPHGAVLNLVVLSIIVVSIFEKPDSHLGLVMALFGGFFLDMFSTKPIGFWALTLVAFVLLLQIVLKNYVQRPIFKKT
ncbi:hypothetical protein IID24_03725 [Patescibacteria group bacterium]|nr:hypothetical protein [Patescibacteria group bacterium]